MPKVEPRATCPLNGFKPCRELECGWYVYMRGTDPRTGEPVSDEWACAMRWLPVLLVESTKAQKETGAAVEDFRNAMAAGNAAGQQLMLDVLKKHAYNAPQYFPTNPHEV